MAKPDASACKPPTKGFHRQEELAEALHYLALQKRTSTP